MESVLLKAKFGKFKHRPILAQNFDGQKGMSDRKGHGHKAVLYKSHFLPLRHSVHSFYQRHRCIHRLINHVCYKGQALIVIHLPPLQLLGANLLIPLTTSKKNPLLIVTAVTLHLISDNLCLSHMVCGSLFTFLTLYLFCFDT